MNKHMALSCIAALSMSVSVIFPDVVSANSFADTYGFSANGMSVGNAMTATANDWSSVYYNVSGLGKTTHLRKPRLSAPGAKKTEAFYPSQLALNVMYTSPQFNLGDIARHDKDGTVLETRAAEDLAFTALVLGLAVDLNTIIEMPNFISSARVGVGMGVVEAGYATKVNDVDLRTHNFLRYGREAERMLILAGLGLGFLQDLFGVGIGMTASFGGKANAIVTDADIGPDTQTPALQTKMDLKIVPALLAGAYVSIKDIASTGVTIDGGVCWRQESYLEIYPFIMRQITRAGALDITVRTSIYDYYIPHVITAGLAGSYRGLTISGQLDFELWSNFNISRTTSDYFAEMQTLVADPSLYNLPKLENIITLRFGASYQALEWLGLLAGYYRQPSYVPESSINGLFNLIDNNRHVLSLGLKFGIPRLPMLKGPIDFTLGSQFQMLQDRVVNKAANAKSDYNPSYTAGGWNPTIMGELSIKL